MSTLPHGLVGQPIPSAPPPAPGYVSRAVTTHDHATKDTGYGGFSIGEIVLFIILFIVFLIILYYVFFRGSNPALDCIDGGCPVNPTNPGFKFGIVHGNNTTTDTFVGTGGTSYLHTGTTTVNLTLTAPAAAQGQFFSINNGSATGSINLTGPAIKPAGSVQPFQILPNTSHLFMWQNAGAVFVYS
jgi:hypothetical protein